MDRYFDTDNFERLLKVKSDEFKMYPTKRVWYSLYNNLHPGRKWPSVAMSITLIAILLTIGYLNTANHRNVAISGMTTQTNSIALKNTTTDNNFTSAFDLATTKSFATNSSSNVYNDALNVVFPYSTIKEVSPASPGILLADNNHTQNTNDKPGLTNQSVTFVAGNVVNTRMRRVASSNSSVQNREQSIAAPSKSNAVALNDRRQSSTTGLSSIAGNTTEFVPGSDATTGPDQVTNVGNTNIALSKNTGSLNSMSVDDNTDSHSSTQVETVAVNTVSAEQTSNPVDSKEASKKTTVSKSNNTLTLADKEWIENYAFYNKPAERKWKGKLSWQAYATPSVVYRTLNNKALLGSTGIPESFPGNTINNGLDQKPSIGLETGVGFQYAIFKAVKIKAGLQMNFTRYNTMAFENTHPIATTLTMNDYNSDHSFELLKTTPYAVNFGQKAVKLHNQTVQLSIPVGADFKIIGNDNLQWNIGATLQPTFVLSGRSYLISSDKRNYVEESSMINMFNLNAGFETFISYKANGFTWQIGPQFRTQLFATNSKKYAVEERLNNYGIKIGVSKVIR